MNAEERGENANREIHRAETAGWRQDRLVAQGFAGFEGVGDAGLGEFFAAEGDEGFALEVEDVLFADELRRSERAAGKDVGKFTGDDGVVFGSVTAADEHVNHEFYAGKKLFAEDFDLGRLRAFLRSCGGRFPAGTREGERGFLGVGDEALRV